MKKAIAIILPKPRSVANILVAMTNSLSLDVPTENTLKSNFLQHTRHPFFSAKKFPEVRIIAYRVLFSYIEKRSVHEKRNTLCDITLNLLVKY